VAHTEAYAWPLSSFVPGVLPLFDLDECYKALEVWQPKFIESWGGDGKVQV
jgi:hypothetical protein